MFNHFLGISLLDCRVAEASNYTHEFIAFYAYAKPQPDCIPVYRWFNIEREDHAYTISDQSDELAVTGYLSEGIVFYVYRPSSTAPGTVELYESFQAGTQDHMYSTNPVEKCVDKTWRYKGVLGRVLSSVTAGASPDLVPVHRYLYNSDILSPHMRSLAIHNANRRAPVDTEPVHVEAMEQRFTRAHLTYPLCLDIQYALPSCISR